MTTPTYVDNDDLARACGRPERGDKQDLTNRYTIAHLTSYS